MKRREIKDLLHKASDGLLGTVTDTLLFLFFIYGAGFGKRGSRGIYQMFEEAETELTHVNYQTIKRAINKLSDTRMISRNRTHTALDVEITTRGKKRIDGLFPIYQTSRPWDGHIYLISYDIPSKANAKRDLLRTYIQKTGGALLQESLWMNPYNPTLLLEEFVEMHSLPGTILVSKLGHDGAIGSERLNDLITRIYRLPEIATRYEGFTRTYAPQRHPSPITLAIDYYTILKDDPQLPFELLPPEFPAEKAYHLFHRLQSSIYTT